MVTDDGLVDLAPADLVERARGLGAELEAERGREGLRLITKRAVTTHNSWMHNHEAFVRAGTNHLYVHPADAARLGLEEGALADVSSEVATVRLPVKLLADLMEGTVALPHGWGHQHSGLSVAKRTRGVNVNLLAGDGVDAIESTSGMAQLTAIPVTVTPAKGPQAATWSGL